MLQSSITVPGDEVEPSTAMRKRRGVGPALEIHIFEKAGIRDIDRLFSFESRNYSRYMHLKVIDRTVIVIHRRRTKHRSYTFKGITYLRLVPIYTLLQRCMVPYHIPGEMMLPSCTGDKVLSILFVQMQSLNIQIVQHASLVDVHIKSAEGKTA